VNKSTYARELFWFAFFFASFSFLLIGGLLLILDIVIWLRTADFGTITILSILHLFGYDLPRTNWRGLQLAMEFVSTGPISVDFFFAGAIGLWICLQAAED
jgi:hypothetical protein